MSFESSILWVSTLSWYFFSQSDLLYTLLLRFNSLKENISERELMLFLVLTDSSFCSDNIRTLVTSGSEQIQRYYKTLHVTSKHNKDHSKIQYTMDSFLFYHKCFFCFTQIKERKNGRPVLEKRHFSHQF